MTPFRLQNLTIESFETDMFVFGINNKIEILVHEDDQGSMSIFFFKKIISKYRTGYPSTKGKLTVKKEKQFLYCDFEFSIKNVLAYILSVDIALLLLTGILIMFDSTNQSNNYNVFFLMLLPCFLILVVSMGSYKMDQYLILRSFKRGFAKYFENYVPSKVKVIPIKDQG